MPPSVGKNNCVMQRETRTSITLFTQGNGRINGWKWVVCDLLAEGIGLQRSPNFIGVGITEGIEFYSRDYKQLWKYTVTLF